MPNISNILSVIGATPISELKSDIVFQFLSYAHTFANPSDNVLTPQEFFRGEDDLEYLRCAIASAPVYQLKQGRNSPDAMFNIAQLIYTYPTKQIDGITGEALNTFIDCVDATTRLVTMWANEDNTQEPEADRRRRLNREAQARFRQRKKPEEYEGNVNSANKQARIAEAKRAWKAAIAQRNEAVRQWDIYIAQLKYEYEQSRL